MVFELSRKIAHQFLRLQSGTHYLCSVKRLHALVLKSFLGPFVLTFFIVVFLLLMQFLWKYIEDLVGKGLEFGVITELLMYTSASLIPMALPLAILLASIMAFGNLGENFELTALKSSGISLQRIMSPLIVITILISIAAFFFSNNVLPYTNLKMRSLLYDIQRQRPELQIKEGIFYNGIEGYSIRVEKKDANNTLHDIRIYDHTDRRGNVSVTVADSGRMRITSDERYLVLNLYNGHSYLEMPITKKNRREQSYPHRRHNFEKQTLMIELTGFGLERTDESLFKSNYQMLNLEQLGHYQDSLNKEVARIDSGFKKVMVSRRYKVSQAAYFSARAHQDTTRSDTSEKSVLVAHPDSLFPEFNRMDQKQIVSLALNQARSAKNYVSSVFTNRESKIRRLRKYQIEMHRKFTLSFACFIFFFIGAPLGAIIRKGGFGMPVVVSTAFFLMYYIISLTGEKFVREDVLMPYQGMWISSLILMPLGVFLTYKATRDSVIMNIDTYFNFFKRFRNRKTRSSASVQ